jgi:hypothetical protein
MSAEKPKRTWIEEIEVAGDQLLQEVKHLVHEGNVRHIRIKYEGREVLEVPVTLAVVGGLIAPVLAAIAAFAATIARCTVEIVREEPDTDLPSTQRPSANE